MTCYICARCHGSLSDYLPPFQDNPDYRSCDVCGRKYCEVCSKLTPLCPQCPGPWKPKAEDILKVLVRICDSDPPRHPFEHVDWSFAYCEFYATNHERIKMLADQLSEKHINIVVQAAKERLADLGPDYFGVYIPYDTGGGWPASCKSKEFVQALIQMKKATSP